jgi:hypothetical protein
VVPIAIHEHFLKNIPVQQTIANHMFKTEYEIGNKKVKAYNIYDFCIAKKAVSGYKYQDLSPTDDGKIERVTYTDRIIRYIVSVRGKTLIKTNGIRKEYVEAHPIKRAYFTTVLQRMPETIPNEIEELYYIRECNKVINVVETNKTQLNLFA